MSNANQRSLDSDDTKEKISINCPTVGSFSQFPHVRVRSHARYNHGPMHSRDRSRHRTIAHIHLETIRCFPG